MTSPPPEHATPASGSSETTKKAWACWIGAILAIYAGIYLVDLDRPFDRFWEGNSAGYSKVSRNYLRFGYLEHKFFPINASGRDLEMYSNPAEYYFSDHPPLTPLWISLFFQVGGASERVYRIAMLPIALLGIAGFACIARRLLGDRFGACATAAFAFFPAVVYYPAVSCHHAFPLLLVLWGFYFYDRWHENRKTVFLVTALTCQALACYSDWPGYYLAPAVFVFHLLQRRRGFLLPALMIGANFLIFGLYLLHVYSLDTKDLYPLHLLLGKGVHWSPATSFSPIRYSLEEFRRLALLFTPVAFLAGVILPAALITGKLGVTERALPAFLLLGLDLLAFPRISYTHEFYVLPLAPYFALSAGACLRFLSRWFEAKHPSRLAVLCIGAGVCFVAASFAVTWKRKTEIGNGFLKRHVADVVARHSNPDDRILYCIRVYPFETGWTADRFSGAYHQDKGILTTEYSAPSRNVGGPEEFVGALGSHRPPYRFVVVATRESLTPRLPYLEDLAKHPPGYDNVCTYWRIVPNDDPLLNLLRRRFEYRILDGLHFFDVSRPRRTP